MSSNLQHVLGPWTIWGLGVGYVIAGMYFGWNLGLIEAGPIGFLIATLLVTVLYAAFVLNYAELTCAMPKAGGAFVYAQRAFGEQVGLLVGLAQWIEFTFAPVAVAWALGAYFTLFVPTLSPLWVGLLAYALFTSMNIFGVKFSAIFELVITICAVLELLVFSAVVLPHFSWDNFVKDPVSNGWFGVFEAIPFAIWFYLAIEAIANIAEEAKNPQRDLGRGFVLVLLTLACLALLVLFGAVGVAGWSAVVYPEGSTVPSDSPLPLAMAKIVGEGSGLYHLLISVGLFGLIASFHGIVLASGRALFELGRSRFVPQILGQSHPTRQTPMYALLFNMGVGVCALVLADVGQMITLSAFGALFLYVVSMLSQLKLRKSDPDMNRPFRAPWYPVSTYVALVLSLVALVSLTYSKPKLALIFAAIMLLGWGVSMALRHSRQALKVS